ncbi:ribitol-5-phosphate transferase FKTN-like [Oratosquilla oratoria]|uniref:ribitol-5-phosphate transferase FKTN-like n=1 Tax=Oratosquilla oratoria TaxID=337810 RepID=UPI003F77737E
MLRVSRKSLLLVLGIISLVIILDQLYFYVKLSNPSTPFQRSVHLDDVRILKRASSEKGVEPILFDSVILQGWKQNRHLVVPNACIFLCHVVGPLPFAVTYAQLAGNPDFVQRLEELGFTVSSFQTPDGRLAHIFLFGKGSPLHLTVLHQAPAGYWRQYALKGPTHSVARVKQYITKNAWTNVKFERAYERFKIEEASIDGITLHVPSDIHAFTKDLENSHFLPCNETRAAFFYLRFPKDESPEAVRFRHKAWKLLAKAKTILDSLNVPFWLSSGTCLGFYRQCDIISWGNDVDIGVFIEDYKDTIVPEFEKRGLRLTHRFGRVDDSFELSFKEDEVKLDIFFFYTDGGTAWNGGTQARTGLKFKYIFPLFTLCWTEFLDLKVRVPCQTERYIVANYGNSWFLPQQQWDWKASPPNVRPNGQWPEEEWSQVIQVKE